MARFDPSLLQKVKQSSTEPNTSDWREELRLEIDFTRARPSQSQSYILGHRRGDSVRYRQSLPVPFFQVLQYMQVQFSFGTLQALDQDSHSLHCEFLA